MFTLKRVSWVFSLLLLVLLLTGCGAAPTQVGDQEGGFLLALPSITVDIASDGSPTIAGINAEVLKMLSGGQIDIGQMRLDAAYVDWFTRTNVQHIELVHKDDGLYIFVNGKAMPNLVWTSASLDATTQIVNDFDLLTPEFSRTLNILLPFLKRTGLDVIIRFPRQAGAEEIALRDPKAPMTASATEGAEMMAQFRTHVSFSEDGVPSLLSVSTRDIEQAFNANMRQLELPPDTIQLMMEKNIQHITIRTTPQGLMLWQNDQALPYLGWTEENLQNGADLYGQLYDTDEYAAIRNAVSIVLPVLNNIDGEIMLRFPLAAGATAIPAPTP